MKLPWKLSMTDFKKNPVTKLLGYLITSLFRNDSIHLKIEEKCDEKYVKLIGNTWLLDYLSNSIHVKTEEEKLKKN